MGYYYDYKKIKPTEYVKFLNRTHRNSFWTYSKRYKTFYHYSIYNVKNKILITKIKEKDIIK